MRKMLTAQVREEIYNFFLPRKKEGRLSGTRETGDLLSIDQYILKESKARRKM